MKQERDISNLLKLLDVESSQVRQQVIDTLLEYGPALDQYIDRHQPDLSPEVQFQLSQLTEQRLSQSACKDWMTWLNATHPTDQLEKAMTHLASIDPQAKDLPPLGDLLDDLAEAFSVSKMGNSALDLNRFLFEDGRLCGAVGNYYHPQNSHLPTVILKGRGLPISLVLIYMMVAHRLKMHVRGFNLPGHFLAVAREQDTDHIIDCFDRGTILDLEDLRQQLASSHLSVTGLLKQAPRPTDIVRRVLLNILNAYRSVSDQTHFDLYRDLLHRLNDHSRELEEAALSPDNIPNYQPGDLIRHVRYGYRGVVVEVHDQCRASEDWYRSSVVRPSRKQPWYHILVDCSDTTTYAAQSSLTLDDMGSAIQHPLINHYFDAFKQGRYQRNATPWDVH